MKGKNTLEMAMKVHEKTINCATFSISNLNDNALLPK